MLGKTEGKRRREQQRMKQLDSITDLVDMNLSKLQEIVKDRGAWRAAELNQNQQLKNLLYNVVLVYAVQESESVIYIHIHALCSGFPATSIPLLQAITEPHAELPLESSSVLLASYFTQDSVYMSSPISQLTQPLPQSPCSHVCSLVSVSLFLTLFHFFLIHHFKLFLHFSYSLSFSM